VIHVNFNLLFYSSSLVHAVDTCCTVSKLLVLEPVIMQAVLDGSQVTLISHAEDLLKFLWGCLCC